MKVIRLATAVLALALPVAVLGVASPSNAIVYECSDGIDNDGNGYADFPDDLGCTNSKDNTEAAPQPCPQGVTKFGTDSFDDLVGTAGSDTIYAGEGQDHVDGLGGTDCLYGEDGIDTINGGTANDSLYGGDSLDFLEGDAGYDQIYGGDGNDKLEGGSNDDRLSGGEGVDRIFGEAGNDRIYAYDGDIDTINCGTGAKDVAVIDDLDTTRNCEIKVVLQK